MPEGHTIHHAARQQWRRLKSQELKVSSPQGRFRAGAAKVTNQPLQAIDAHGKHLFYRWETGRLLHVHLGLYGKFRWHKSPPPAPRGAIRMRIVGDTYTLDLHGPTACEVISAKDEKLLLRRLGPDPLHRDADAEAVWRRISKSHAAIGSLLLNQSVIAGIGNVYRAELLFALGIHPEREGRTISRAEFDQLWKTICDWMALGAKHNRIITTADQVDKPPSRITKSERLRLYKKEFCTRCDGPVESWLVAARTIYACPVCQV